MEKTQKRIKVQVNRSKRIRESPKRTKP